MRKVLVLEDEENIRSFVVINLKRAGYTTIEAGTGEDALAALKENPDVKVALLDIMLPGIDGFEVCRRIRAMDNKIGIIMLTARTQEMDKVTGLMTGADDYVTKPFSPAELTARVDALYRRTGGDTESLSADEISDPPFLLNTRNRTLEKNGQRVKLTQVEYSIVKLFMENPGKALAREEILDAVWGKDYFGELKIVDVNIQMCIRDSQRTADIWRDSSTPSNSEERFSAPCAPGSSIALGLSLIHICGRCPPGCCPAAAAAPAAEKFKQKGPPRRSFFI